MSEELALSEQDDTAAGDTPPAADSQRAKCPFCDFTCQRKTILGRHIHFSHPEAAGLLPAGLSKRLEGKTSLAAMLHEVAAWLEDGISPRVPEEFVQRLKEQDGLILVALRVIALEKVRRVLALSEQQARLDERLAELTTEAKLEAMSTEDLLRLQNSLARWIKSDLEFVKDALTVGQFDENALASKLATVFGSVKTETLSLFFDDGTELKLPESPWEREQLRNEVLQKLKESEGREP